VLLLLVYDDDNDTVIIMISCTLSLQLVGRPSTLRWKVATYFSQLRWKHSVRLMVQLFRFSVVLVDGLPMFQAKFSKAAFFPVVELVDSTHQCNSTLSLRC